MSEEQLAGALGCEARAIVPLAMCFMPRSEGLAGKEGGTFREDVEAIAAAGPCDAAALGRVVKEVAAVVALGEGIAGGGWLMAARDRQTGEKGGDLSSGEKGGGT
jgi:hypothetical protein